MPKRGSAKIITPAALWIRWAQVREPTTRKKASGMRRCSHTIEVRPQNTSRWPFSRRISGCPGTGAVWMLSAPSASLGLVTGSVQAVALRTMQARSEVEPLRASQNARVGVYLLHKISESGFSRADDLRSKGGWLWAQHLFDGVFHRERKARQTPSKIFSVIGERYGLAPQCLINIGRESWKNTSKALIIIFVF